MRDGSSVPGSCCGSRPGSRVPTVGARRSSRRTPSVSQAPLTTRTADLLTLQLGILLALACAFASNLAFLYKHRGACAAPPVDIRTRCRAPARRCGASRGSRSAWASAPAPGCCTWPRSPWRRSRSSRRSSPAASCCSPSWPTGSSASRSARRQWSGSALTTARPHPARRHAPADPRLARSLLRPGPRRLRGAACSASAALLIMGPRVGVRAEHHGVMLAAAAGILFGVCNVGVKALTGIAGTEGMLALAAHALDATSRSPARSPRSTPRPARCRTARRSRSSPSPAPRRTSPASPAASSSSATRCPAPPRHRRPGPRLRPGHRRLGADARSGPRGRTARRRPPPPSAPFSPRRTTLGD